MHYRKKEPAHSMLDSRVDSGNGSPCVLDLWTVNERTLSIIEIWGQQ